MSFTHAVPFSATQLQMLAAWGETRPFGIEIRIATDRAELDEVAELFRCGQDDPAYCLTAVSTGEIDIIGAGGASDVVTGLGAALAWVERQEAALTQVSP